MVGEEGGFADMVQKDPSWGRGLHRWWGRVPRIEEGDEGIRCKMVVDVEKGKASEMVVVHCCIDCVVVVVGSNCCCFEEGSRVDLDAVAGYSYAEEGLLHRSNLDSTFWLPFDLVVVLCSQ